VYPDRHWVMYTSNTFSPQGYLLELRHRNQDDPEQLITWRHDERGRSLEREQASETRKLFSYRYDALGRLDSVVLHSAQGGERVVESLQDAADGTKTRILYLIAGRAGESMLDSSSDTTVIMTVFDADDRRIRKVLYDQDDRVIRRLAFRYDERGLLLEEGELVGGSIRGDFRRVYDTLGRRIEADSWRGDGLGGDRRTFTYNERGDIAQEVIEQSSGILGEEIGLQTHTRRFTYRYDDFENWVERTRETIPQTGEARLSMVDRRELTYY
jgi:hypothetical protein